MSDVQCSHRIANRRCLFEKDKDLRFVEYYISHNPSAYDMDNRG